MSAYRPTRARAITAIVVVWILVCGGLAWATRSAVKLEGVEANASREKSDERAKALALSRLDAVVEPILARERARPYSHFRSRFKLAKAFDAVDGAELKNRVVIPSPLDKSPGPDWILLHFQVSETQGWSSPQLPSGDESAPPVFALPAAERSREVKPENWFAALKRYSFPQLLQEFEQAFAMVISARQPQARTRTPELPRSTDAAPRPAEKPPVGSSEAARRFARLDQLERENFPLSRCEPELVALENLESGNEPRPAKESGAECVEVRPNLMMPVWLDLTLESPPRYQLAWIRTVTVATSRYCTLQGVLIDWDRLRETLESEIRDLFPKARIVPIVHPSSEDRQGAPGVMQTIPARLEIPSDSVASAVTMSHSLRTGLTVAWCATILALAAVAYGTLKYVGMTERRMEFVAAVTHELRTPLTSFQLYSDLLADTPAKDEGRRQQYSHRLQTESKRLSRLVENVLAYSRIGVTAPKLERRRVTARELLESAASIATAKCDAANKKLVLENRADAQVETDAEFVVQILANLIENACKYSTDAADPSVWLSADRTPDGGLCFEVEDAGLGVLPADRRTIFEPFRRTQAASASGAGGVGLGLALSRHWAECLGGTLTIKRGSHNGSALTCFALTLPPRLPS